MGWASDELSRLDLGDARLNKRAATLAEAFAESPTASIPGACRNLAEIRAAYRFFDHENVTFWGVLGPHVQATEQRMRSHHVALCLQDTTSLDFNGQDIEGLGPLNYEAQRGLQVHPTYVVTPGREPLGLIDSWNWARECCDDDGERPAEVIESRRWVDAYERIAESAASMPDTRCVCVGDRESDLMPLMRRAEALDHPADWLVRAKHDRVLGGEDTGRKLFERVAANAPIGEVRFVYRERRGTKARAVVQQVRIERCVRGSGWSVSHRMTKQLACDAMVMAIDARSDIAGVIMHTDRGSQYCSDQFRGLLRGHEIRPSMSARGDCFDNACAKSFFRSLWIEAIHGERFTTREPVRTAVLEYIELYYNTTHQHSTTDNTSPVKYELANAA